MKNSITIGLFILLLSFGCKKKSETVSATSPLEVFADSLFQSAVDSTQIAGASALVFQDGKSVLDKSYGYASLSLIHI